MKLLLTSCLLCLALSLFSQGKRYVSDEPAYQRNIDLADGYFDAGNYQAAIPHYREALQITEAAFRSKYRLASCYLLAGEYASADVWLRKCAEQHPADLCPIVLDEDLELYRFRPFLFWQPLQWACLSAMPRYNYLIKKELEEIRHFDQFIRSEHRNPNEADCKGKKYYWPGMTFRQVDSVNELRLESIIKAVGGYPGLDVVGESQKNTAWLVIQHAPIEYQERYYPLVEQAAKDGQIKMGDWAYLVDRMHMNRQEKQVYGSQMWLPDRSKPNQYELYPLEDPFHVNERRAEVGLGPIEDYISGWGLKFEPEKMK